MLPSSPAMLSRTMRCFQQKLMVCIDPETVELDGGNRQRVEWAVRVKRCTRVVIDSTFCCTTPNTFKHRAWRMLAAVWHCIKAVHASIATCGFSTWSATRQNRDHCTLLTGDDCMTEMGTKHAAITCDPVQYLTNVGETHTLSEYDVAPAEKYFVRVWAVAGSTTTSETFNKLRVEHYASSSDGIDALPRRSGEIRGHVHGRAFRVNKACRLHVTDHEDYVTMVSYYVDGNNVPKCSSHPCSTGSSLASRF